MILEKRERFKRLVGYFFTALLFVVLTLGCIVCSSGEQRNDSYRSITPDPEVQAEINRIVSLLGSPSKCKELGIDDFRKVIDDFKSFERKEVGDLLLQVLLVYGGKAEYREDPNSEMTKRMLIFHLSQEIPEQELISLIAPHLEKTTDPILKKGLCRVLELVAFKSFKDNAPIDFVEFDPYMTKHKDTPPHSLIMFMYRIKPKKAVVAMARIYAGEAAADELENKLRKYYSTLREEDGKELFESLSMSNQWWIRLYVAEIMLCRPVLRTPEILERLKKDKHPLVSEVLSRF